MALELIHVEIVCALPDNTRSLRLQLKPGATVGQALHQAAQAAAFSGVDWQAAVGIFGRIVTAEQALKDGDRVELYRPLAADPKAARRKRVVSKSGRS